MDQGLKPLAKTLGPKFMESVDFIDPLNVNPKPFFTSRGLHQPRQPRRETLNPKLARIRSNLML